MIIYEPQKDKLAPYNVLQNRMKDRAESYVLPRTQEDCSGE